MHFETVFQKFCESTRKPVVSFDFDGVLHTSVIPGTHHPNPSVRFSPWELTPNQSMIRKMREEAKRNQIVIVSARDEDEKDVIEDFIDLHNLPVRWDDIYLTDNGPKTQTLKSVRAIRHYDDNAEIGRELKGTGIEFIHVKL